MREIPVYLPPTLCVKVVAISLIIVTASWIWGGYTDLVVVVSLFAFIAFAYATYAGFSSLKNVRGARGVYLFTRDQRNLVSAHTMYVAAPSKGDALISDLIDRSVVIAGELRALGVDSLEIKSPIFFGPNLRHLREAAAHVFGPSAVTTAPNDLHWLKLLLANIWSWSASMRSNGRRRKFVFKWRAPGVRIKLKP